MKKVFFILVGISIASMALARNDILIEAESFCEHGGWVVDQQFISTTGSPVLLAHGMGVPVPNASTTVNVLAVGAYRLWVRTWNWVSPWTNEEAPGQFQLFVNDENVGTFGDRGKKWAWQDGGVVHINEPRTTVRLHDLTGFEGRCDAIVLCADTTFVPPEENSALAQYRSEVTGHPVTSKDAGEYDLVVIGGGMAGTCAAISAARLGVKVALVQNRPVLGGNNSSEVRVHALGKTNLKPYPRIGDVANEISRKGGGNASSADTYQDDRKLKAVLAEENIDLYLNWHAYKVETKDNQIQAIIAMNTHSNEKLRFSAPLFVDCTGDGTIGYLAGADYRYGREGQNSTNESMAPEQQDKQTLGTSVLWYAEKQDTASGFPDCPWAIQFNEETAMPIAKASWKWETGMNRHQIEEFEYIRDYMFRAIYGNWAFLKNASQHKDKYANLKLAWVAYIGGKRESRRLMGDVILTQQDIQEQKFYPDACVTTTWSIDLHYPQPENEQNFPADPFLSYCEQPEIEPYPIPYRCLYSRNIDNLFMAGRCISVTHVALGTIRVMRTTGMMGEVVGMAASICKKYDSKPRDVYHAHLDEFKTLLTKGVGKDRF